VPIQKEKFQNKITLHNWWEDGDGVSVVLFQDIFRNVDKNIEIYSVFGEPNFIRNPDTLYVQYSGESRYSNPSLFDINIIPSENEDKNIIHFPHAAFQITYQIKQGDNALIPFLLNKRTLDKEKEKFCLFAVSNPGCKTRNDFFSALSTYKKVDSCGSVMNNIGSCPNGFTSPEFYHFISNYKFMICFENVSQPNYFTEKLVNAYYGGAIPIYWGCTNIHDYVNMEAILYLKPNFTENEFNDLIKQIEYLDNNPDAYRAKYETTFFKDGKLPDAFNIDKIREKVDAMIQK